MISAQGENLVFQLGIPRSGTTLLSVMLNNHPQVRCPPEPWIMLALNSVGLTHARNPADAPVLYRAFRNFCPPQDAANAARSVAVEAYNRCLKDSAKTILVDKTPRYYLILDYLRELFPQARYVLLWRNPLDAALSMKTTWKFDAPNLLAGRADHPACIDLVLGLRYLRDFARKHADVCYCMQYEPLARDGAAQMNGLLDWLKLPRVDDIERFDVSSSDFASSEWGDKKVLSTHGPHQDSIGKWREGFSVEEQAAVINGIGADLITDIGYGQTIEQAGQAGVKIAPAGDLNYVEHLQESLRIRRLEYDNAPTYSDLSELERELQKSLQMIAPGSETWQAPNLAVALQAYAKGAAELAAREQELHHQLEQSKALEIAYQARTDESRDALARLGDQMARSSAEWSGRLATAEADLQSQRAAVESQRTAMESQRAAVESKDAAIESMRGSFESERLAKDGQNAILAEKLGQISSQLQEANQHLAAEMSRSQTLDADSIDLKNRLDAARMELGEHKQARIELDWRLRNEQEAIENMRGLLHHAGQFVEDIFRQYDSERATGRAQSSSAAADIEQLRQRCEQLQNLPLLRWGSKIGIKTPLWDGQEPAHQSMEQAMASESLVGNTLKKLKHLIQSAAFPKKDEMDAAIGHLVAKGFRPKVVYDIGAAKGYWTERFAWRWKDAEFFLIDPLEESEPFLKALCERENRFHYILAAVGRERGFLMMNVSDNHDSSSLLGTGGAKQRRVTVESIDALLTENKLKPPDLVKLDVQGFELSVMDGGQRMFDTAQAFIIEVNLWSFTDGCPRVHEVVQYMAQRKFFLFDIAGTLRRPFEDDLGQMDLVFVSENSPLGASNRWA